jgi:hypothetical protein
MRSLFVAMIMLSASMAVVDTAQAQMQKPPGYGSMQAPIGHRQPTQDDLQPTQGNFDKIDKDNQQLHLPASQDGITGARPLQDTLTSRIGQDNPALDSEITDICPTCGGAKDAPVHHKSRPIHPSR